MPRTRFSAHVNRHLVCLLAGVLAATAAAAADAPDNRATDQMLADCHAEGEAGGLEGAELEAFVRDCVADLLSVEIKHLDKR